MYKMVRKGNTSLQYTIIPQTDQLSSSSFPQSRKSSSRVIKYTMATLTFLIILSCIATPFLIGQNDQNLFTSSVLAMGRRSQIRNTTRSQIKEANAMNKSKNETSTVIKTKQDVVHEVITPAGILKGDERKISESITTDSTTSTQHLQTTPELLKTTLETFRTTASQKSSIPTSTMETLTSSTGRTSELPSRGSDKTTMVTLKLLENETIPEQYEEAGISDFKIRNASALAAGVSLEKLVFKTSEGTMKPRSEKRFFINFHWQGLNDEYYIYKTVIVCCLCASVVVMSVLLRRRLAERKQSLEKIEEAKMTLLKWKSLNKETEDIETRER